MDRERKLRILGQGNEHDQDGLPSAGGRTSSNRIGIYQARSSRGAIPLMRTMMTSSCAKSCGY
jgi:predicted DNA-binding helix-hairpin-helix protein